MLNIMPISTAIMPQLYSIWHNGSGCGHVTILLFLMITLTYVVDRKSVEF